MRKFGVSQSVMRKEDVRFLTGHGRYLDDLVPPGAARLVMFRSPVAHARITALDVGAAREAPGVLAVFTAADLEGKMQNALKSSTVKNRDGSRGAAPVRPVLAAERVCFAGEGVAAVVAETEAQALDAAELIAFEYDDLPVHIEVGVGGPEIHPEAPDNLAFDWTMGDEAATDAAFARAAHTTRLELVDNRVIGNALETRGATADWRDGRLHVGFTGQGVWSLKDELVQMMGLAPQDVHVTTPDVGGGFGIKIFTYPEYCMAAFAARELGRAVHWRSGRGEGMLADNGGRDRVTVAEAAFDADYRLLALRSTFTANLGAYNGTDGQLVPTGAASKVFPGVYDVQTAFFTVKGVYTNTAPVDAYRGAGRPEAIYTLERLMDWSARDLGVDPVALRRKNFIPPDAFPYKTVVGELYDVGDFNRVLDKGLIEADVAGFPDRRAASARAGKLRGLGLCYYIESILGDQNETTTIAFAEDGMVDLHVGTQSNGQGHETVFAQFLAEHAGIPFDKVRFVQGDSDLIAKGGGTGGSRSVTMQGNSIIKTAHEVIKAFRPLAEEELEVSGDDLVFEDGAFRVAGTDRSVDLIGLAAVARRKGLADLLATTREFVVPGRSFPNGVHVAEVEIEPDTGRIVVAKYTVVDDFGFLINPMLVEGQVHGGVAQGIGQAIAEHVVFSEDGQLLSGSFMDYAMPRSTDLPFMAFSTELVPSTANEIGMKGCGEAGTVGALAAVTNAALDALWDAGVRHVDMPMTPQRVWSWLQEVPRAAE